MVARQWDHMDEEACREAKALTTMTANQIRQRASHVRIEELMPGLERLEHRAAVLCGDIEHFARGTHEQRELRPQGRRTGCLRECHC